MVTKKIVFGLTALVLIAGCTGRKPEATWTAEEYFHYAKDMYDDESYFDAVNEFTIVILRFPGSSVADSAQFYLASCHYNLDEYIISAAEYSKLINNMPQSPLVPEAQFMLAESYFAMSPRPALDQEYSIKALREYQIFLDDFIEQLSEKKMLIPSLTSVRVRINIICKITVINRSLSH